MIAAEAGVPPPPSFRRRPESSLPSFRRKPESSLPSFRRKPESILTSLVVLHLREDRLTSLCFSSAIHGAGYFLLLAQKKVTKEKGTLAAAVLPGIPARETTRAGYGVRRQYVRVLSSNSPASCRRSLRGFSSACSPRPRGAREERSAAVPAAEALGFCSWVPLKRRRRADGSAACTARGRREGSRRFGCRPWMACQPNPFARSGTLARGGAAPRALFSLVTFFCTSKRK